ncbi:MAG TPA: hypothetical protein VHV30_12160, partial [Polyangiaceae bacterium]|nr:hypothetical protein [Polyangiaceae bacterium]
MPLAIALLGVSACAASPPPAPPPPAGVSTATLHPPVDFAFDSVDDRAVTSASTRGKPTVLAFITTSSLSSQAQIDFLAAMAR